MRNAKFAAVTCAVALMAWASWASAGTVYSFYNITNDGNPDVGAQLTVDVSAISSTQVSFLFKNLGPIASSITAVYFDDGTLLDLAQVINFPGVQFTQDSIDTVTPHNLAGWNLVNPNFKVTKSFSADSNSPTQPNGVNPTEQLNVIFDLQPLKTSTDTIAALANGGLRIGIQVQAIGLLNGSDSYINNPTPVPLPAAAFMGMGLMGVMGIKGIRRRRLALGA